MVDRSALRDAFSFADDVLELEGFALTGDLRALQQRVIDGDLSFEEAVAQCLGAQGDHGAGRDEGA